ILTQLCFFQSYHDVEIILLVEETDRPRFEWVRWYPHCRIKSINVTGLVSAENQRDQVLGNVAQVLKMRKQKQDEEKKDARFLPHYVFIVDNPKLIINHSIMEYLQTPDTSLGFSMIYTTHIQANLPEYVKTVFLLTGGDYGTLLMNEGNLQNRPVTLPAMDGVDLETMARKLAPLRHMQGVSTQIPEAVTFFELYGVKRPAELPVLDLWARNACHKSLAVPLGLRGKDDIVALNLHEKAHGPHGLVAGTTGSGKSEIVQSYILSLAVNFHPHEVGFLLIDYKGGGMANLFANLPHLLGTITNLDGSESMRALASIKSELQRRQRIFGECGVNNINQYTKLFKAGEATLPLPHLFIISDEFAELKKEQPEFMSELVSTARIGRSLGVHLILATQKPTGVVDDQIWSNSKFKLALKVANEGDSNEVLKTPDAARITQPGRAYLQVGNNEIYELFQSAWSGAPYSEEVVERGFDSRVYLINQLGQGVLLNEDLSTVDAGDESKLTQLDVVVDHVQAIHESLEAVEVDKPWLPPLSDQLVTSAVTVGQDVGQIDTYNLTVPLGMADIPEEQRQVEYVHSFPDDGNLAVFGASGFGKSTTAMTTALTLASQNSPRLLNYFVLDYGNSALAQLRGLPHMADYLGLDDAEKLDKLVKLLTEMLKERKHLFAGANAMNFRMYNEVATEKLPAILLLIDNYDVIREISPELEEFLVKLTRDGTGLGIYTVITATRTGAVRYSVLNNFKNKIAQFMFDKSDITAVVGRSAYDLTEVRGRALVKLKDVHITQCYLPVAYEDDIAYAKRIGEIVAGIAEHNSAPAATGVRIVPETVMYADLTPFLKIQARQAVLGFDTESTEPLYLDLIIPNQLIVGGPSTGKTNILKLLLTQLAGSKCFISDSRAGDLADFESKPDVTYMGTESQLEDFYTQLSAEVERRKQAFETAGLRQREFIATQPTTVVLIDDGDTFVELCKAKAADIEKLISKAMELGVTVITTTPGSRMKGFDNLTKMLKDAQVGVVLGNPGDQSLLPMAAPRNYKPVPDLAFWFKRGDARQVKLPFMG
ncbi:MAG: type VII secretion protein EssC, partial [Oscillospiraceae bacterium]|nr:type VII secretion protein EssC [Oscillospiraceae bacterium]